MRRVLAVAAVLLVASPASAETWLERLERDHQAELAALAAIECKGDLRGLVEAPDPMDAATFARMIADAASDSGACAPNEPGAAQSHNSLRLYRRLKLALARGDLDLVTTVLRLGLDLQRGTGLGVAIHGVGITEAAVRRGSELVASGATGLDDFAAALDALLAAQPPIHDGIRGEAASMVASLWRPAARGEPAHPYWGKRQLDAFTGAVQWEATNRARDELVAACGRDTTPGACQAGLQARRRRLAWTPIRCLVERTVKGQLPVLLGVIRQRAAIHALRLEVAVCAGEVDREALLGPPALGLTLELIDEGGGAWRVDGPVVRRGWPLHRFRC